MPIEVHIGNNISQIVGGAVPSNIFTYMSIPYETYTSKPRKGGGFYPDKVTRRKKLLNKTDLTFPTGYLFHLVEFLEDRMGLEVDLVDHRIIKYDKKKLVSKFEYDLWKHQQEALATALSVTRGIICIPTGGGKTSVAAAIIANIARPTLFVVNGIDLMQQTIDAFKKYFPKEHIGVIGSGKFDPQFITIAMIQSLWANFKNPLYEKYLEQVDVLIGDEVHHVAVANPKKPKKGVKKTDTYRGVSSGYPGNIMYNVFQKCGAYWRFGLTATPGAEDSPRRMFMRACIGKVIHYTPYHELAEAGILAPVRVFIIDSPRFGNIKQWRAAYDTHIQKSPSYNNLICNVVSELQQRDLSMLVMSNRLHVTRKTVDIDEDGNMQITEYKDDGHAKLLAQLIRERLGIRCVLLSGEMKGPERHGHLKDLDSHDLHVAVSTIAKEGIDIPYLNAVVYACGGRASTEGGDVDNPAPIQAVGRALRNPPDKGRAVFVDFLHRDGGVLEAHSFERMVAYREHGFTLSLLSFSDFSDRLTTWLKEGV